MKYKNVDLKRIDFMERTENAVTLDRMTAIKVRNLSQNNGYLARIEEVSEKDVDPDWREDVEELKRLKYEKM